MLNLVDFTGKNIIITGASKGIGRDTAVLLSKLGAKLILIARTESGLLNTQKLLDGNGHKHYSFDLSNITDIECLVNQIVLDVGPIDGLVYAAGINSDRPLKMFTPEKVEDVIKINLGGYIELIRCITKKRKYNFGMRIVGVSSVGARKGSKAHIAYSTSKSGMEAATRCLAIELADKGICVNTVAPGMINTEMYTDFLKGAGGTNGKPNLELLERQYLGLGRTSDVAAAIAFLLSSAAKFITGICLPVDGGQLTNINLFQEDIQNDY